MKKWTIDICRIEALKYKRKIDFLKGNKNAYGAAYKHRWLDEICRHMEISGDKYNRCIYAYEFPNKSVYIGLTYNLEERDKQHKANVQSNNSCVLSEIKKSGENPDIIKLSDYIYYEDAAKLEGEFVKKYKDSGWIILNRNMTGSLGSSNLIYTKDKCKEIISKCIYLSDLYSNYGRVVAICKINGWFQYEINNLVRKVKVNNYWNKERCINEAKLYDNISDFIEKSSSAYRSSLNNKWLTDVTSHMCVYKKGKGYWNYETCKEESKKYNNRFSFQKGSRGAYKQSYNNKWLDDFFI